MSIANFLFGKPLASDEENDQKIGPLAGIPVLGLDALSSAAYGPEAALTLLLPIGALGLRYIGPIIALILAVLFVVYFSYRQTIAAYPNGGGSYTVAKENLGTSASLLAASALALDYVLNVAVGISAGVGALVSALPALLPHTLALCLVVLIVLTLVNLRGTREAGLAFMLPTYAFVGTLLFVIGLGCYRAIATGGHPTPVVAPPAIPALTESVTAWLLVRAFASGCTAMTGVEAVSNGVPVFRAPTVPLAQRTLTLIIGLLALLLAGVAYLSHAYGIAATEPGTMGYQSVLSMLVSAVVGRGAFYYFTLGSIVAVLALSANTSFADFPRLCRVLAMDRYLPDFFAHRGRRLVYSSGVVMLSLAAGVLLVAFGGITDRLIPLFAIGAFLAFTLSQAGMVQHWRREGGPAARHSLPLNAAGAVATGVTLVVVIVSKFAEGAWLTLLLVPVVMAAFYRINRHYRLVAAEVAETTPLATEKVRTPVVVVPIQSWNKLSKRGIRFALELSPEVYAVQVLNGDGPSHDLEARWDELVATPSSALSDRPPRLVVLTSTYRQFFSPFIDWLMKMREENRGRDIVVVIPDLVVRHWYHAFLHNNRGTFLKTLLRLRGGSHIVVVSMPFYLHD